MPRLRRTDGPTLPREAIGKRSRHGDAKTDMTRLHSLDQSFVIVGAGLAGAKAAETLRAIQRLIRARVAVDDRRLANPDVPLEDLVLGTDAGAA
jgi:hypothetical protein